MSEKMEMDCYSKDLFVAARTMMALMDGWVGKWHILKSGGCVVDVVLVKSTASLSVSQLLVSYSS